MKKGKTMKTAQKTDITFTLFKLFTLAFFVSAPLVIVQGCAKEATKIESKVEKEASKSETKMVDGDVKSETKMESKVSEVKSEPVPKTDLPKP